MNKSELKSKTRGIGRQSGWKTRKIAKQRGLETEIGTQRGWETREIAKERGSETEIERQSGLVIERLGDKAAVPLCDSSTV